MYKSLNFPGIDLAPETEYRAYPVHLERLNWLFKTINENRPAGRTVKVLDVGCGTGNITVPLGLIPDSLIEGIDLYQPNVDEATAKNKHPNVKLAFSYLQDWDISDIDFIIFTEVLEHIPNYGDILQDIANRAKKGCKILITIPNGWGPFEIAVTPMYWMRKIGLNGFISWVKKIVGKKEPYAHNQVESPHVNFFTRRQLARDCKTYGFTQQIFTRSFVFSPVFETYLPFVKLDKIAAADNKLAQKLPAGFASGWYMMWEVGGRD